MTFTENVVKTEKKLRKIFEVTPLQYSKYLSDIYGSEIYLKREDLTPVRSYKIRGAFNFMESFLQENNTQNATFVCSSAGNFAQGVAFSCHYFEMSGKIFMPTTTPAQKINKTKDFGGKYVEIILTGDTYDQAGTAAQKYCKENSNKVFIHPYDHPKTIEGNGTIGQEILKEVSNIDFIIMPVGGGGLSSGVAQYFAENSPKTEIIATEPLGAPSLYESIKAKKAVELDKIDTFIDGAAVGHFGQNTFKILQKILKRLPILIPENRVCQTMLDFLHHKGIVLEPAGALSIDALKDLKEDIKGKKVVCVVSGGNFDFERLPDVKERAMKYLGLKKYLVLRLPQRPGALKEFLGLLGAGDDIARFEYLKKSSRNFGSILLGIETKDAKSFPILFDKMKQKGFDYKDVTDDEILADFLI